MTEPAASLDDALVARVAGFVATMRSNGFTVGMRESTDALTAAAMVGIAARDPLRWAWRSLLCQRADDWSRFDDLFDSYWLPPNRKTLTPSKAGGGGRAAFDEGAGSPSGKAGPVLRLETEDDTGAASDAPQAKDGASAAASLEQADFRHLGDRDQVRAIEIVIRAFAMRLKRLRIRRERAAAAGARIDLRRTLRRAVGTAGSPGNLVYLAPQRVRPRLVLLLDVSRSMSLYSFFYLRMARALVLTLGDVHVFAYHTHLTHISDPLRDDDPWRAQERLHLLSAGWAGGTRIGECVAAFNRQHAGRLVHSRTALIIASDGYDTGEPGLLGTALSELARRARLIAWLNPAKAAADYAPLARGMREALPHIDLFAAGNSVESLQAALGQILEAL
jgi:uncharacterized protein with von Willebrand factor type A (vWA) domain